MILSSEIHTCQDLDEQSMDERDDLINEAFLYVYEKKYPDGARETSKKIVITLSQPSINYHYFIL